jgi:hypothetical protein
MEKIVEGDKVEGQEVEGRASALPTLKELIECQPINRQGGWEGLRVVRKERCGTN